MKYLKYSQLANWRKQNTPRKCPLLGNGCFKPCVDHDHKTGLVRGVISMEANTLLGRIENSYKRFGSSSEIPLSGILRNMADYLEMEQKKLIHPVGMRQICSRFSRQNLDDQELLLTAMGAKKTEIKACNNSKQRTELYRNLLKHGK